MNDNLIGYLLDGLDEETQQEVEGLLESDPEIRRQYSILKNAIIPLGYDEDAFEPPGDLASRTIAMVAEQMIADGGKAPVDHQTPVGDFIRNYADSLGLKPKKPSVVYPSTIAEAVDTNSRPRNVIATIGLSLAVLALLIPGILVVREQQNLLACQNNLRMYHQALVGYSDQHGMEFPQVREGEKGASFVHLLHDSGVLPSDTSLSCPGTDHHLARLQTTNPLYPDATVQQLDYAYAFGYRDRETGQLVGLTRHNANDQVPIMADSPVSERSRCLGMASPAINHRKGQNVLFVGGNVRFCTHANLGLQGDDNIYCNQNQEIRAGVHPFDFMLGRANEMP